MTEKQDLRSRLVVGRKRDGRREFDEAARQELVELCLKPGVPIARAAMDYDVNPNQLRKWITNYQQRQLAQSQLAPGAAVADGVHIDIPVSTIRHTPAESPSAFMPVVSAPPAPSLLEQPSPPHTIEPLMAMALHVRLPTGVEFDLGEANVEELTAIVQTLGRLACSGSTKD
ncbi:transposase [Burkholderia territorii]|uniref:Transposase n=1 Tax=Burkholderia territorii TaxID=1503055 RepID=A0A106DEC4_9BURK|nr:transposase [Burkholderia territorii]KVV42275.1 transposase [Burkholderia territorii]KVX27626.1 transposase [Burkholderia territorii]